MFKAFTLNLLLFVSCSIASLANPKPEPGQKADPLRFVDSLNEVAYNARLKYPEKTIQMAYSAFSAAKKINYLNGEGEACRIIGIGQYYLSLYEKALDKYLQAISYFEQADNEKGIGKVYNNIGNLYLLNDYDKALQYYNKSLAIAKKSHSAREIAGIYVNIGLIQMKKKNFSDALQKFQLSMSLFKKLNAPVLVVQCMQNIGEAYSNLKQYRQAENVLKQAIAQAETLNLNYTIAGTKLTLANVYLHQNKFEQAKATLDEGIGHANSVKNRDLQNDYNYAYYQLEYKKKNYKAALDYLKHNFTLDSAYYRQAFSKRISLASDLFDQLENRRKNERIIERQKYATTLFWSSVAVAGLLAALVVLLIFYVRKTARSNRELKLLHTEVSRQKENLDRINHHLEDIINERTHDLKEKNKKLSDYSLHLSHHIRGPIVTLKGIVYLEQNNMIDREECISLIKQCVFGIDDEIISMSKMLNDDPDFDPGKI